jgi:hypothetical protein
MHLAAHVARGNVRRGKARELKLDKPQLERMSIQPHRAADVRHSAAAMRLEGNPNHPRTVTPALDGGEAVIAHEGARR